MKQTGTANKTKILKNGFVLVRQHLANRPRRLLNHRASQMLPSKGIYLNLPKLEQRALPRRMVLDPEQWRLWKKIEHSTPSPVRTKNLPALK